MARAAGRAMIDSYGILAFIERALGFVLVLGMAWRARRFEDETYFDYRRRAVFAYTVMAAVVGTWMLSALLVAAGAPVEVNRFVLALGFAVLIVGFALLHLGWPGPRRDAQ